MTRIFLSHSSQDNPRAFALAQWLRENGWQDVFLDRIPRQGIAAGEDWKARIHEALDSSVAGIFLISRGWMASEWCRTELTLAYSLNKLIFGVLVDNLPRDEIPELLKSNWQLVDLHGGRDHDLHDVTYGDGTTGQATLSRSGLANLKEGLHRARIAPEHFTWPPEDEPDRPPWRGLSPMEPEDAGIFFGREAQTGRALDAIRALRDSNPPRLLAIVGASGAGKSSFLRAGLIPRLRRDDRNYLTLPPIRPEGGALDALAKSLTETTKQKTPRAMGEIRRLVHAATEGEPDVLSQFLTELAHAHRLPAFDDLPPPVPTIILPIDQGEELFQSSGRAQGGPFLSLLSHLLHQDSPRFLALITIRSDSYEALQNAPQLSGLNHSTLSLPAIAKGEYSRVITGPIDKLQSAGHKLAFDPAITDTLLAEFDKGLGRDALPLLAFTLDRLYRDYSGAAKITLDDYKAMGGIAGSIDAAVERALQIAARHQSTPNDPLALQTLLRRTMIPWFAGIDPETGTARRNVSARDQLPPETLPLVDALIDQRLLTSDGNVIEPAHEALLREWRALNGWLIADREKLATLEALRRAAADWQAKARHKDYLAHKAGRLEEAERLADRPDLWQQLGSDDRAYLAACRAAVRRQSFLRTAVAAGFASVVVLGMIATGYQARVAHNLERAAARSQAEALALLALSRAEENPIQSIQIALSLWPQQGETQFPRTSETMSAISNAIRTTRPHITNETSNHISDATLSSCGKYLLTVGPFHNVNLHDIDSLELLAEYNLKDSPRGGVRPRIFTTPTSNRVVVIYENRIETINIIEDGDVRLEREGFANLRRAFDHVFFLRDEGVLVSADSTLENIAVWSRFDRPYIEDRSIYLRNYFDNSPSYSVRFSSFCIIGNETIAGSSITGRLSFFDIITGERTREPIEDERLGEVDAMACSRQENFVAAGDRSGNVAIWSTVDETNFFFEYSKKIAIVSTLQTSIDGNLFIAGRADGSISVYDLQRMTQQSPTSDNVTWEFNGPADWISTVLGTENNNFLISTNHNGRINRWENPYHNIVSRPREKYLVARLNYSSRPGIARNIGDFSNLSILGFDASGKRIFTRGSTETQFGRQRERPGWERLYIRDGLTGYPLHSALQLRRDQDIEVFVLDNGHTYALECDGEVCLVLASIPPGNIFQVACRYLPHINGRPDSSTDGLAAEIGIEGLTLPEDCDTYDLPLPPEFRR